MTAAIFSSDVIGAACASRVKWDIPASVSMAQWVLESNWGRSMPPNSNNPFGIKAVGTQPYVACLTHEVIDGRTVQITAKFRKFTSLTEAFDAHGELLATNSHYSNARLVRHNADAFARALTGVYATDPQYGSKLIATMSAHNLYAYDKLAGPVQPAALQKLVPPPVVSPKPLASGTDKPVVLPPVLTSAPKPQAGFVAWLRSLFSRKV